MLRAVVLLSVTALLACGGSDAPKAASPAAHGNGHRHSHPHENDEHRSDHRVHRFDNAEEWATRFDHPDRDAWQRPQEVVALLEIEAGMTVADLGAGTGYFEPHLSRAVGPAGKVLALDVEADMVRYIEERAQREGMKNVEARQVAYDDPQLAPSSVDRVVVVDTWHHVGDRKAYAAKLARGLRPKGWVAIVDFTLETQRGPPPEHRLAAETVLEELRAAGLEASQAVETLPDQYVIIGRKAP